ncbi:MAG: AI-2E family transporter [Bacteroidales bacterium]|jgi:predicted PurR-regulated permease PerM|nr:AI-2E family transporter [Bacteroidales bacterium]MDD2631488.1 AI-2E family transporter [Bacteroidales bacterium]MDD4175609.1 AI-2E family transporter [Bacteroidales bacterium]MDD4741777.1 AI-2E family transporter [Bacteroidales bacterium]MDY0334852.1 AI-2E family transporter [Bacteroidales bacterium]
MSGRPTFIIRITYFLIFLIAFTFVVIIAKSFLVTLVFGLLISSLIFPVCQWVCKLGVPKGLSIFITIILMIAAFTGLTIFFGNEISKLVSDFPTLKQKALANINEVSYFIEENFGVKTARQKQLVTDQIDNLFTTSSEVLNNVLSATTGTLFKMFIMPVYVFFLLYYRERFNEFVRRIVPAHEKKRANKMLTEISFVSQRYLGGAFIVVVILSVINSLGLWIIGLKYAILFGVVSAFFNFIPYFGTWIGAFFPFMFALLTGDSPNLALWVLAFFALIQFTENNILTPNITGGYVRLNPFITILALIAGSMVWGVAGMLLAIPIIASLKIIFENFESTKPIAFLLERPESSALQKRIDTIKKFFGFKNKDQQVEITKDQNANH